MDWFVLLATSTVVGATIGALVMGLISSRSYDRGYDDALHSATAHPGASLD